MKRCTLKAGLPLTIAVFSLSVGLTWAGAIEIGDSMRELVKADWIDQADRFVARTAQQKPTAQPGSFDPACTREVLERGKALVVRLRADSNLGP